MSHKIETIKGTGEIMGEKLCASATTDIVRLPSKSPIPKDRAICGTRSGISGKITLNCTNRADLIRMNGVGRDYVALLEVMSLDGGPALAQWKAKKWGGPERVAVTLKR